MNYFEARYLDSNVGRFTQVDPQVLLAVANILSDPQSLNSYAYARNNPVRYNDPNGEKAKEFFKGTVKGFGDGLKDFVVGAAISGGITYWQTGDWSKTANAAIGGAVQGALFAAVGPASLLTSSATGAASVAVGSTLTRALDGEKITASNVAFDAGVGGITGGVGYGLAKVGGKVMKALFKDSDTGGQLLKTVNKTDALNSISELPKEISSPVKSFFKGGSNAYDNFSVSQNSDGTFTAIMEKPGNVPGSRAVYIKNMDSSGNTVSVIKKTYDPKGKLLHSKDKL